MGRKTRTERAASLLASEERERVMQEALRFSRTRFKHFDEIITSLFEGIDLSRFHTDRRIWKVNKCFKSCEGNRADKVMLRDIFLYLARTTVLMANEHSIHAVMRMFQYRDYWRNSLTAWLPQSSRTAEQVKELTQYLFCKYEIPAFMYGAVYELNEKIHMQWLAQLGSGSSPVDLVDFPLPFTRKMGSWFTQAPDTLSIKEAIRWAQAKGMNAGNELARRIAYSWLSTKPYSNEEFWQSFLRIVIEDTGFEPEDLGQLVDYVREMKRVDANYSLKGRTLASLLRQSEQWHYHFGTRTGRVAWGASGITGFRSKKKNELILIEEITDSGLLTKEGQHMRHCVGSYAHYCATGKSAIFSMRKYENTEWMETMATIEVNLSLRRIVQAKAKMNRKISDEAMKQICVWADKEGLEINAYL